MADNEKTPGDTGAKGKRRPLVLKQKIMRQVVIALVPLCAAAVYFFGWRFVAVLAVMQAAGFLCEYLFARTWKQQVSEAVFVTNTLFALSLPPTIPLWIAVVGIAFGVVFGKMVFGGFGRYIFNPAISGRAFVYVSFGVPMTAKFTQPAAGFPGGLAAWLPNVDAVTKATPLVLLGRGEEVSPLSLLLGNTAGSFGETCAALILICGLVIVIQKAASWRIVLGGITSFLLFQLLFWLTGAAGAADPVRAILSGSALFAIMFLATDPVSSSQSTDAGRWIYGALIGALIPLIRTFSVWPEAVTFAILLANMFAPLLDYLLKEGKKKRAAKKGAAGSTAPQGAVAGGDTAATRSTPSRDAAGGGAP